MTFTNVVDAYAALMKFAQQRGEFTLRLALHAAIPQGFTVDLLQLLAFNFVPEWTNAEAYTAVAHLLSSPLCLDLGTHYEYDPLVRPMLLNELARIDDFENIDAIGRTANFLLGYIEHAQHSVGSTQSTIWWEYLEVQRWTALTFLDPDNAAEQMAAAFQHSAQLEDTGAKARLIIQMGALASSLSQPLSRHEDLLRYIKACELLEQGQLQRGQELLERYGDQKIRIGQVELSPAAVLAHVTRETDVSLPIHVASSELEISVGKLVREERKSFGAAKIASGLLDNVPSMPDAPLHAQEDIESLVRILKTAPTPVMILSIEERINTYLAIAACHHPDVQEQFNSGIFWIWGQNIVYEPNRIQHLNRILDILVPHHSALTSIEDFSTIIGSLHIEGSFLFVLTDVEIIQDLDSFISLLRPFLENPSNQLLLTTATSDVHFELEVSVFHANTRYPELLRPRVQQVFISYARADDEAFVERLYSDLRFDFNVWWDRVSLARRGIAFTEEIRGAIASADHLLLVAGPKAFTSEYVRAEWHYAYENYKGISVVLRLGEYADLPTELADFDVIDFRHDENYEERLAVLKRQLAEQVAPIGALFNVPPLPPHFITRNDILDMLRQQVLHDIDKQTIIRPENRTTTLIGMGGVGKSTLAIALVRDRSIRFAFPDGIIWLSGGREADVYELYRAVGRALGDDLNNYSDETRAQQSVQKLLSLKQSLLVLDNVRDMPLLHAFQEIIRDTRSWLLITTRDAAIDTKTRSTSCQVSVMTEREAVMMLTECAQGSLANADPSILSRIVSMLGYLPLAIEYASAQLQQTPPQIWLEQFYSAKQHSLVNRWGETSTEPDGYLPISWGYRYKAVWQNEYIEIYGSQDEPLMFLHGHTANVNGVLELPDGRLLSWSEDRTLRIWSQNGQALAVLKGHTDAVTNAELLEDERIKSTDSSGVELIWSSGGQLEQRIDGTIAIIETAQKLESLLYRILDLPEVTKTEIRGLYQLWQRLEDTNIEIPPSYTEIVNQFWDFRNRIVHSVTEQRVSENEIDRIVGSIQPVIEWLQGLGDERASISSAQISPRLLQRIIGLLIPFMNSDVRPMRLRSAFSDSALLKQINYSGSSRDFTTQLVAALIRYGNVESGKTALVTLLESLETRVGGDIQREIRDVIAQIEKQASPGKNARTSTLDHDRDSILNQYINIFMNAIQLTNSEFEFAQQEVHALRGRLQEVFSGVRELEKVIRDVVLFGSLVRNTAITPISDIDALVIFRIDPQKQDPKIAYEILETGLLKIYRSNVVKRPAAKGLSSFSSSILIKLPRSWMEVSPAAVNHERQIVVPNQTQRRWIPTNHLIHEQYTSQQNKISNGMYSNLVQVFKWWQYNNFPSSQRYLSGFALECLVAQMFNGLNLKGNILEEFAAIMQRIQLELRRRRAVTYVPEIGVPKGRKLVGLSRDKFSKFIDIVEKTTGLTEQAISSESISNELFIWQRIFGSRFPTKLSIVTPKVKTTDGQN